MHPEETPAQRFARRATVPAILLVAAALRLADLGRHSLWFDETIALRVARASGLPDVLRSLPRLDSSAAPLHPMLLHGWIRLFGPSDAAARALSAALSVAAVAAVSWAGAQAFGPSAGRWAAWLQAINPLDVYYAREARMYALLVLLTTLAWGLLFSLRRSAGRRRQAAYLACLVGLCYAHPLGALMVAALAVGYVIDQRASRLRPSSWLVIHALLALALWPWVGHYLDHPPDLKQGFDNPVRHLTWPQAFLGGNGNVAWIAYALIAWGVLRPRPASGPGDAECRPGPSRQRATLACLLAWYAVPYALLWIYSQVRHPVFGPVRYLLFLAPPFLILVARGLASLPPRPRALVAAAGFVVSGLALRERVYDPSAKPDWRAAAAVIQAIDPTAPVVVLCPTPHFYPDTLRYYLASSAEVLTIGEWSEQVVQGMRHPGGLAWFVGDRVGDAARYTTFLDGRCATERRWSLVRLDLSLRQVRADVPPVAWASPTARRESRIEESSPYMEVRR